jgi:hypothetical protein
LYRSIIVLLCFVKISRKNMKVGDIASFGSKKLWKITKIYQDDHGVLSCNAILVFQPRGTKRPLETGSIVNGFYLKFAHPASIPPAHPLTDFFKK